MSGSGYRNGSGCDQLRDCVCATSGVAAAAGRAARNLRRFMPLNLPRYLFRPLTNSKGGRTPVLVPVRVSDPLATPLHQLFESRIRPFPLPPPRRVAKAERV